MKDRMLFFPTLHLVSFMGKQVLVLPFGLMATLWMQALWMGPKVFSYKEGEGKAILSALTKIRRGAS